MILLVIGVLLFAGVHLTKSLAPSFRTEMQQRLGENGYKGIFSLLILGSIALIVFGWRSAVPQYLYTPPAAMQAPALFLLVVAFWLMVVSSRPFTGQPPAAAPATDWRGPLERSPPAAQWRQPRADIVWRYGDLDTA